MGWTAKQISLAFVMLVTGSINTLSAKWADLTVATGREGYPAHEFDHPFLQAVFMFVGEFSCLIVFHCFRVYYKFKGKSIETEANCNQKFNPFIFLPAAMCDMTATSIMYVGLTLTLASSFQMLRGAVMIFTALLSVIFLRRVIRFNMWLGMIIVLLGLITVGLSDILFPSKEDKNSDTNGIISGDLLIILAQIIVGTQMVYEEKFVLKHNIHPLQAVGWEGFFGLVVLGILNVVFNYIPAGRFGKNPQNTLEDPIDAFLQMGNSGVIRAAIIMLLLSIAFFNFAGISVTKELSATTRMVLDSCRTLIIWGVSLIIGWQTFQYLQIIGFVLLITGMCLYNYNDVIAPWFPPGHRLATLFNIEHVNLSTNKSVDDETQPILPSKAGSIQVDYDAIA